MMKKVIGIIYIFCILMLGSTAHGANECASTLSDDLKLHIPVVIFSGSLYSLDLEYDSTHDGFFWFKYNSSAISTLSGCSNPASLFFDAGKIILRVPMIFWDTTPLWLEYEYVSATDGLILFKVTNGNLMSNWVFVTSVTGNGNLGSWADAGGKTGIDAGDAICEARADAAGLNGTFKAWLSDDNNDAYCRIHNLTGKKSDNCGQTILPVAAGPWVRTDGFPFGETIDQLLNNGKVYAPVRYDEFGHIGSIKVYYTNTDINGVLSTSYASPCSNWHSSTQDIIFMGHSDITSYSWTAVSSFYGCDWDVSLLCFQTGVRPSLPNFSSAGKKVFVTSVTGNGNLSSWPNAGGKMGIEAGDAICQARAQNAGLTNAHRFKAWLSDSTTNAIDRITSNGPWVRLDGVKIADSKSNLTDGSLFTSINLIETGIYRGYLDVWTGTGSNGNKSIETCNNWTDGTSIFKGLAGRTVYASNWWTDAYSDSCDYGLPLFCFED